MEFAAVCPIMRVHGSYNQKRQPWVYGPVAEAAATQAIELRYVLKPYLYSLEHEATETGLSPVRPLFWEFPDDPSCANVTDSWMFGPTLLVAPVLEQDATTRTVYLPTGTWYEFASGKKHAGGAAVQVPIDNKEWKDLPMFVRSGSILATQPVEQYAGQLDIDTVDLDVWPDAARKAEFTFYDDDGSTTDYRNGRFYTQKIRAELGSAGLRIALDAPSGSWRPAMRYFRVRVHGVDLKEARMWAGRIRLTKGDGYVQFIMSAGAQAIVSLR
jgi:alpha-glucosidase (family GH31 glycosyl hydrolase)